MPSRLLGESTCEGPVAGKSRLVFQLQEGQFGQSAGLTGCVRCWALIMRAVGALGSFSREVTGLVFEPCLFKVHFSSTHSMRALFLCFLTHGRPQARLPSFGFRDRNVHPGVLCHPLGTPPLRGRRSFCAYDRGLESVTFPASRCPDAPCSCLRPARHLCLLVPATDQDWVCSCVQFWSSGFRTVSSTS